MQRGNVEIFIILGERLQEVLTYPTPQYTFLSTL
jgi:hypothetical protein